MYLKKNFCHKIFILQNYKNSYITLFSFNVRNIFLKFEKDCLKNEGGDSFLVKLSFFAVLVFPSYKVPVIWPNFDRPYLKN